MHLTESQLRCLAYAARAKQRATPLKGPDIAYPSREYPKPSFEVLRRAGLVALAALGNGYTITDAGLLRAGREDR